MLNQDIQPEMIGREIELGELKTYLDKALNSEGSAIFISGEAGIGKTRLVNELGKIAQSKGFKILLGNSLYESFTPYMPMLDALRSGGLEYLFTEEAPRVEGVYLITNGGMLIKDIVRKETKLNPDIFASMLTAMQNYIKETLSDLSKSEESGTLNTIGGENYSILIDSGKYMNLAVLLTGKENEFIINDIREINGNLEKNYNDIFKKWDGDIDKLKGIEKTLEPLVTSGKYDGIYYGKRDPKARRDLLFENVLKGLARHSKNSPTLLCIEDLQWADPSTLSLLHYLARNTKEYRLFIIGTYRSEDIASENGNVHPLSDTILLMDNEELCEQLNLHRLPMEYIDEFLYSLLGEIDLDIEFKNRIFKESEGNPLFIIQLVKFLVEEKILSSENGKWKLTKDLQEIDVPSKIYTVIVRRLNRLEKADRMILDYASVIGETFNTATLAHVMEMEKIGLQEELSDLEENHRLIISLNGNTRFHHAKIKEVLYNEIPNELRMEYHGIIASSIETLNKDLLEEVIGDLAFHYYHCRNKKKALFYLLKAAEQAKEEYSNEESIKFYNQALEFMDDDNERLEIFESKGDIYGIIGEYEKGIDSYKCALGLTEDIKNKAQNIAKIGGVYERKGEMDEAIRTSHEALDLVKGEDCMEEALALRTLGVSHWHKGELSKARDFLEKCIHIREKNGDMSGIITCLNDIGRVHKIGGEFEEAMEFYEKALKISNSIDDQAGIALSLKNIGTIHHMTGDLRIAIDYYKRSLKIQEKIGDQSAIALCLYNIKNAYGNLGEVEKVKVYGEKSMSICEKIGDKEGIARFVGGGREYSGHEGYDKAIEDMKVDIEFCERYGLAHEKTWKIIGLASMYYDNGDFEDAKKYMTQALDLSKTFGFKDITAEVLHFFGRYYRVKKQWKESIEYYNESLESFERIGMVRNVGYAHIRLGFTYKEKGDIERARTHLNKALEIHGKFNMERSIENIKGALRDLET
ncbi:MAG: tetratricopeptide repeat protein [Thermoplasmata archaeon]|nr:MAG: tetratricopeptide repeat protein [Thermoplasmata archaeon]